MEKTKILVDSTGDMPLEWMKKLDADVIPLHVLWEERGITEDDSRNYDDLKKFWDDLVKEDDLPKTSQPAPVEFKNKFEQYFNEGYTNIFVLTLSTQLSGAYNSALLAAKEYGDRIVVLDSKFASSVNALVVYRIRELLDSGLPLQAVWSQVKEERENGRFGAFFYISNFDFLRKGGRVSGFASFVGTMLNLRVSLFINEEGIMIPFGKSRGTKKAQKFIIKKAQEYIEPGSKVRLAMVHVKEEEEVLKLLKMLESDFEVVESVITPMGKVIASHVGPGTAGFGIEKLD
ncbi:MAG TPA: DegV family protein [Thermotogota bacterium]|nr:DegV family protein [Thermotogota bacterium]HPJ88964.1 DegV family protein [Thermotogota bacterium]HPR95898.1 DegV family protein [Thermotogota bacterium]